MNDLERLRAMSRARGRADRLLRQVHPQDWQTFYEITLEEEGVNPATVDASKRHQMGRIRAWENGTRGA